MALSVNIDLTLTLLLYSWYLTINVNSCTTFYFEFVAVSSYELNDDKLQLLRKKEAHESIYVYHTVNGNFFYEHLF